MPEPATLTIPRRAGSTGSRVVEVVHVRAGAAIQDRPRRMNAQARGASWDGVFAARQAAPALLLARPVAAELAQLVIPVVSAPEPTQVDVELAQPVEAVRLPPPAQEGIAGGRGRKPGKSPRRIADPFDPDDDGANCMRCGYAVEPAREKRGLLTCAECG